MKKMRKLIPAFAMLLVSAIMMSTASFAWFTMNEEVEVTGMQLQAKSTGSLIIGEAPLILNASATEVVLTTGVQSLKPVTWAAYRQDKTGADVTGEGWCVPAAGKDVNEVTGITDGDLKALDMTSEYYIDKEIYIASAGDALTGREITVTLNSLVHSAGSTYKAYAAALYVFETGDTEWANDAILDPNAKPDAIAYLDTATDANTQDGGARNVVTLKGEKGDDDKYQGYNIPSVVGVEDGGVGVKIYIRFFVDGNLDSTEKKPVDVYGYSKVGDGTAASATYRKNVTYYADANGQTLANVVGLEEGANIGDKNWYTYGVIRTENVDYKLVNSTDVPTTGSQIDIAFAAGEVTNP